jgi:hypothetical protein
LSREDSALSTSKVTDVRHGKVSGLTVETAYYRISID